LYVVNPDGSHSRLKSYAVKGGQNYTMKTIAEDPTGKHAFEAAYTKDEKVTNALAAGSGEKSLPGASLPTRWAIGVGRSRYHWRFEGMSM
jgi:hypothetical protein